MDKSWPHYVLFFLCFLVQFFWSISAGQHELLPYDPVADPKAIVTSGNARFTVLTPYVIRMEYSTSRKFEDRATIAVLNRKLPVPQFTTSSDSSYLYISTKYLKLQYRLGSSFSSSSLQITSLDSNSKFVSWHYGQENYGNLLGTIKSLDELGVISLNCTEIAGKKVHDELLHCEWGLISRLGWNVINDTTNWVLDSNDWWAEPNTDALDLYFFGHGHNYKLALNDYIQLGGKIALTPRYVSGVWWSIWLNLNNFDVMQIVNNYENRGIPLDVYILDMDWHTKEGWGGYTFDSRLFARPENTLSWLHAKGLHSGANLHDDDGVRPNEKMFVAMAESLGLNPKTCGTIPFSVVNASIAYALEDIVLKDAEKLGMDFWWIDWQQGGTQGGAHGDKQNPTIWLNHLRSTDHLRRGESSRGLVLARWGGLGNHRYQVGFSGDVADVTWQNLAFQPYFSMTATNVGYGFWSHDIVGPANDHELHTRWVQWGAFSGVFRTHDRGMSAGGCADDNPPSCGIVEIWKVPDVFFQANRAALVARERLIPYIYNAYRQAFDTGLSLIRPMYYDYPEFDLAYSARPTGAFPQYMFGDNIMISPIVTPASTENNLATTSVWIPPGKWISVNTGTVIQGNSDGSTVRTKSYDLSEIPMFVKAGSIIPTIEVIPGDTLGLAQRQYNTLEFSIYPGTLSGSTTLYEDDGMTTDYLSNKYVLTTVAYTRTSTTIKITLSSSGSYPSFPTSRKYRILLVNHLPVIRGDVNGISVSYSRFGGDNTWHYRGPELTTVIETSKLSTSSQIVITVVTNPVDEKAMSSLKGLITKSILSKQNLDQARVAPGDSSTNGGNLSITATSGEELEYLAGVDLNAFYSVLANVPLIFQLGYAEVKNLEPPIPGALLQLWDSDRGDNCLCGSDPCINANNYYQMLRIEGYQPKAGTPGTIPLNDFWNPTATDNYATTGTSAPSGYEPAAFGDGLVFASQQPGTVPLKLYYNGHDMLTVASPQGIDYANQNKYKLLNSTLGYVYSNPPQVDVINQKRWAYSMGLLNNIDS